MGPPLVPAGSGTRGGPGDASPLGGARARTGSPAPRCVQVAYPTWEILIGCPRERLMVAVQALDCHHDRMGIARPVVALLFAASLIVLAGCSASEPVIAPVTRGVGDLQGATVELEVGQMLDIDTGDLPVESYSGVVSDTSVARFIAGREEGGATYNPGVEGLAAGTTKVVLSNDDGGIQDVTFTVEVSG